MKYRCFFAMLIVFVPFLGMAQPYDPIADPSAVIHPEKNVRFTVLTPTMIRMEWDSAGYFTSQASFVVVNRRLWAPAYTRRMENGWLIVRTDSVLLKYKIGSGKFGEDNLQVVFLQKYGDTIKWYPGRQQKENLKGTYRTLDGYDGDKKGGRVIPLEDGILARDGWTLIDDSRSFLFDKDPFPWVDAIGRHSQQDWYLLMYGSHYKQALKEYASIGGRVPLPPRYAFGFWWSRYWRYSDNELRSLVGNFRRLHIPLDVLVIDMDWHKKGWTGWTWDSSLFTNPGKFLQWTKSEHLKTTLNLHPADGIGPGEMQYAGFAHAMHFDTTGQKSIPYIGSDKRFMKALFDTVLHPYERMGINFWWLDWQQWPHDRVVNGLSNTWWLNYVFFSEMERSGDKRPMLYHRWGGLGNHRYQIGFSGDAVITWKSLEFQPYFTNAASNVLYDYWSHDIGGHVTPAGFSKLDPELYTRWMQYGALSPIFRTHSTKNSLLNKEPWNFSGIYADAINHAIRLRYELAPYIYTMARKTYDSAVGLCRPLYYDYPGSENAYTFKTEYQFGDDLLVAPIGAPADSGITVKQVWLPEGNDWYEWNTGTLLKGGSILDRPFSIDEYPLYVKAGAIIPMNGDTIQDLNGQPETVHVGIFPGAAGKGRLYEDDGDNKDYSKNYSITSFSTALDKSDIRLAIAPVLGGFKGMRKTRNYVISFYGRVMPASIIVSGQPVSYGVEGKYAHWYYDGRQVSINLVIPDVDVREGKQIVVHFKKGDKPDINGLPEKLKRLYDITEKLKYEDAFLVLPHRIAEMEELGRAMEYYPDKYTQLVNDFNRDYQELPAMIQASGLRSEKKEELLKVLSAWIRQ